MKKKVPYLIWRNGRPRWEPGPHVRARGFKGRDLKDKHGNWLNLGAAIEEAEALNAEAKGEPQQQPKASEPKRPLPKPAYTLRHLWEEYAGNPEQNKKSSPFWKRLRASTQADYRRKAEVFLERFGDGPPAALTKPEIFAFWEELYEGRGHAMANGVIAVFRRLLSYGELKGRVAANKAARLGLPGVPGRLVLWLPAEASLILETADKMGEFGIGDAFVAGLHMGQRRGDILALPRAIFTDGRVRLSQAKTSASIDIKQTPAVKARLEARDHRWRKAGTLPLPETFIVDDATGEAFDGFAFTKRFALVREKAAETLPSLADKLFMDTRDTAVTRLALSGGYDAARISAVSGHSLTSIHNIMKHYLVLNRDFADDAIDKLVTWLEEEGIAV